MFEGMEIDLALDDKFDFETHIDVCNITHDHVCKIYRLMCSAEMMNWKFKWYLGIPCPS